MAYESIILGLALLSIGAIFRYSGIYDKVKVQMNWINSGGLVFLLIGTWKMVFTPGVMLYPMTPYVVSILSFMGVLFVLIGIIWTIAKILKF